MVDWIPGISQVKSLVQSSCGDNEGALKTQENFVKQCPLVSPVTGSLSTSIGKIAGDSDRVKFGEEALKQGNKNLEELFNSTPIVGEIKGGLHHLLGETDKGNKAMESATSATGKMVTDFARLVGGRPEETTAAETENNETHATSDDNNDSRKENSIKV